MVIEFSSKSKVTKKGGHLQMEPALIFSDPQKSFIGQQYFLMPYRVAGLFRHGDYRHVVAVRRKFHTTIFHCRFLAGV